MGGEAAQLPVPPLLPLPLPLLSLSLSLSLLLLLSLVPALHCGDWSVAWERKQGARAGTGRRCKRPHTACVVGGGVGREGVEGVGARCIAPGP